MPYLSTQNWLDYYSNSFAVQPVTVDIPLAFDTFLQSLSPTTNRDTDVNIGVGENNATASIERQLIKPDFSLILAGHRIISASLYLTPVGDFSSNARTMSAHRTLRAVVSAEATWNIYSTGNNWGTAGCSNSTTDYDGAIEMGTGTIPASPTLNVALEAITFSVAGCAELQKLFDGTYTNNGLVLFVDTQTNDLIRYASTDNGTAAYRPYITVTYILA
jgi:hypothetical protein